MATPAKKKTPQTTEAKTFSISNLQPAKGSVRDALRVGRGRASGAGKTSNRGHNGEGQRAGRSRKRGFEGGQMPGYRKTPKLRSFKMPNRRHWLELNVGDLEKTVGEGTELTYALLQEKRLLTAGLDGLRVLGNGELKKKLVIHAHHVTPGARQKIEAAGGSIVLIGPLEKAVPSA